MKSKPLIKAEQTYGGFSYIKEVVLISLKSLGTFWY